MSSSTAIQKGLNFEHQVWEILKLAGYDLKHDCNVAGRQTDFVVTFANKLTFPNTLTYLVKCLSLE